MRWEAPLAMHQRKFFHEGSRAHRRCQVLQYVLCPARMRATEARMRSEAGSFRRATKFFLPTHLLEACHRHNLLIRDAMHWRLSEHACSLTPDDFRHCVQGRSSLRLPCVHFPLFLQRHCHHHAVAHGCRCCLFQARERKDRSSCRKQPEMKILQRQIE